MCIMCQRGQCRGECEGCSRPQPSSSTGNITISMSTRHFKPASSAGHDNGRLGRYRDSVTGLSLPQISEDSSSFCSSTSTLNSSYLRSASPASLSSLSSLGSSTYSSSFSSIDDLDEPCQSFNGRPTIRHSTPALHSPAGSGCRPQSRKRKVSFHPNVLLWTSVQQGDFAELLQILSRSTTSGSRVCDRLVVNVANHQGITPLHLCSFAGADECARLLLLHGAAADCWDDDGWTPLHAAAVGGHNAIVSYLVRAGGDIHRVDAYGRTAMDVATSRATQLLLQRLSSEKAATARPRSVAFPAGSMICTDV